MLLLSWQHKVYVGLNMLGDSYRLLCCLRIILHRMLRNKIRMPSSLSDAKTFARMRAYFSINYRSSEPGVLVDQIRPEWRHLSPVFSSRRRCDLSIRRWRAAARSTRDRRSPGIRSSRSRRPSNKRNTSPDLSAHDSPTHSACPRVKWRYMHMYSIRDAARISEWG